jgi:general secretion pathway protein G
MNAPQLDYAGPKTPRRVQSSWPWVDIAIALGLLVVGFLVFTPHYGSDPMQAKIAAAETDVSTLGTALQLFQQDTGRLPTDAEGLDVLVTRPTDLNLRPGPYLKHGIPTDPWGNAYVYHATRPSGGKPYTLLSRGPDWIEGTSDDIVNK